MKHVSVIVVRRDSKILMGRRRDNKKWTTPAGCLNEREDPLAGAVRELSEETGLCLSPSFFHLFDTMHKEDIVIHGYLVDMDMAGDIPVTIKNDPDKECSQWKWMNTADLFFEDLHVKIPDNIIFRNIGMIMKSEKFVGGLADGKPDSDFDPVQLKAGMKVESEHTSDEKAQKEIAKDHLTEDKEYYKKLKNMEAKSMRIRFVPACSIGDLFKAFGYKYLRKYKMRGKWVYVYSNGNTHSRLSDEEVKILHGLAETNHKRSKKLVDNVQEITDKEYNLIHELAATGHTKAANRVRELVGIMGDHYDSFIKPKYEPFDTQQKEKAKDSVKRSMKDVFDNFARHPGSDPEKAFRDAGITADSVVNSVDYTDINTMLTSLNEKLKDVDRAMAGVTSRSSKVNDAGGYGNSIYIDTLGHLERTYGIIPAEYAEFHKRKMVESVLGGKIGVIPEITPIREFSEKIEEIRAEREERERQEQAEREERERRERAEREEQERREMGELSDTIGYSFVSMLKDSVAGSRIEKVKKINETIKEIFGKDIPKEAFPYDFSDKGITVKISRLSFGYNSLSMSLEAYNSDGEKITDDWQRSWDITDGRPHIYNALLTTNAGTKGGSRIGALINKKQWDLMSNYTDDRGGTVTVSAGLTVGPYMWANLGFSFQKQSDIRSRRSSLKNYLQREGINLSDDQLASFKEPCHFAAIDTGKKYLLDDLTDYKGRRIEMSLSPKEKETGFLGGDPRFPLTEQEKSTGKANRMAVHFGKYFMLQTGSWRGIWDSKKDTVARKYGRQYVIDRASAAKKLGRKWMSIFSIADNQINRSVLYFDIDSVRTLMKSIGDRYGNSNP